MQCDKQPSPWPCVAMIVGLLLFCLAAPQYWQHDASPSVADADIAGTHGANEFTFKDSRPPQWQMAIR